MSQIDVSDEQWLELGRAPLAIFGLVALADGSVSAAERKVFVKDWLSRPERFALGEGQYHLRFQQAFKEALQELPRVEKMQRVKLLEIIRTASRLMKLHLSREQRQAYSSALLLLAEEVAGASRGRFGIGPRVSTEEEDAIERVRQMLGLPPKR